MTFQRTGEDIKRHKRQKDKVLDHLLTGAPLTQDAARDLFGCMRLACKPHAAEQITRRVLSQRRSGQQMIEHFIFLPLVPFDVFSGSLEGHADHLQTNDHRHG